MQSQEAERINKLDFGSNGVAAHFPIDCFLMINTLLIAAHSRLELAAALSTESVLIHHIIEIDFFCSLKRVRVLLLIAQ